ncbi:hypothetical protein SISNIDRAFT_465561 [Sistotremastrum niveocremeum HHB9708]|uniref:Uncharacterized protein n=1 Tax=Sistotremastrum niveocremeum HHB9708 TaxID=1314777 RepID=A0A164VAH2_9AGAM|nr:hypothetical protein SISNIDRAFT_465561 [Sistotremastrum niveocremeum HHB9708]
MSSQQLPPRAQGSPPRAFQLAHPPHRRSDLHHLLDDTNTHAYSSSPRPYTPSDPSSPSMMPTGLPPMTSHTPMLSRHEDILTYATTPEPTMSHRATPFGAYSQVVNRQPVSQSIRGTERAQDENRRVSGVPTRGAMEETTWAYSLCEHMGLNADDTAGVVKFIALCEQDTIQSRIRAKAIHFAKLQKVSREMEEARKTHQEMIDIVRELKVMTKQNWEVDKGLGAILDKDAKGYNVEGHINNPEHRSKIEAVVGKKVNSAKDRVRKMVIASLHGHLIQTLEDFLESWTTDIRMAEGCVTDTVGLDAEQMKALMTARCAHLVPLSLHHPVASLTPRFQRSFTLNLAPADVKDCEEPGEESDKEDALANTAGGTKPKKAKKAAAKKTKGKGSKADEAPTKFWKSFSTAVKELQVKFAGDNAGYRQYMTDLVNLDKKCGGQRSAMMQANEKGNLIYSDATKSRMNTMTSRNEEILSWRTGTMEFTLRHPWSEMLRVRLREHAWRLDGGAAARNPPEDARRTNRCQPVYISISVGQAQARAAAKPEPGRRLCEPSLSLSLDLVRPTAQAQRSLSRGP